MSPSPTDHSMRTKSILARSPSCASSSSGSSISGKSVQWGENDSNDKARISPGQYSVPEAIVAADLAIDAILKLLVSRVKDFKCPSELEFSLDCGSPMMLPDVEKNKSFIGQLHKLQKLAYKLDKTPTHSDAQLKVKHNKVSMSIGRALFRMEQVQIQFYVNFLDSVYEDLSIEINVYITSFVYPCELDFAENSEDGMVLANTGKNKSFIDQLRTLGSFRVQLNNIPEYDNEKLRSKREAIGEVIERNLHMMKQHQLKLFYRRLTKARQTHRL